MSLDYPWPTPPAAGEWCVVAEGVSWLRLPLPFALNHVNIWLLDSDAGVLLIDTGVKSPLSIEIWTQVLAELPRTLEGLLVTHYHPDHIGLAAWMTERNPMPVWVSQQDFDYSTRAFHADDKTFANSQDAWYQRHGLDTKRRQAMHRAGNTYRPYVSGIPANPLILQDQDDWLSGDTHWQVMTVGGHAPEMICLYSRQLNVLIAADHLLPAITPNISLSHYTVDANPLSTFLDSLAQFETLPQDVLVLPSHGLPYRGLHQRIAQLRTHHSEHFSRLVGACTEPATATDMLPVLFPRELDYQQLMFAMGESIAHLTYLSQSGALKGFSEAGQQYFVRAG